MSGLQNDDNKQNLPVSRRVKLKLFYNQHFPTDQKTYSLRIPFVGLILSVLSATFITSYLLDMFFREDHNVIIIYCYIFAAFGVNYELYYGLTIGDRKQYTPWIILKLLELVLTVVALICGCVDNRRHFSRFVGNFVYGLILLVVNTFVTYGIVSKSLQFLKKLKPTLNNEDEDNNYNIYDTV